MKKLYRIQAYNIIAHKWYILPAVTPIETKHDLRTFTRARKGNGRKYRAIEFVQSRIIELN